MPSTNDAPRLEATSSAASAIGAPRPVPFDRPWQWLSAGWRDLWAAPSVGLFFGALATGSGLLLSVGLAFVGLEALIPVAAGGFLLVGPLLAVGLYETSRSLAAGDTASIGRAARVALAAARRLSLLAAILMIFYLVWVRVAVLLVALFLGTNGLPPARELMPMLLFTSNGLALLVVGTIVGAGFAAIVFATTAISLPMLTERRVDAFTAMALSARAVLMNPQAMALWAALITGFIALGLATLGAGLILAFPLIGHATWHAYRDLIAPE